MHSVCMMRAFMLGQVLAVVTAALSSGDTNTQCSIATISLESCLQPPSVTLCCQFTATTCMHSVCMMHTLMLGQLLAVATAALSRGHTNTLCSTATIQPQKQFKTTSVTLCCQTTATTSMHTTCMMHTLMLGQLLVVATAALTSGDTNTLCSIATITL
jgi:hypothetical protein